MATLNRSSNVVSAASVGSSAGGIDSTESRELARKLIKGKASSSGGNVAEATQGAAVREAYYNKMLAEINENRRTRFKRGPLNAASRAQLRVQCNSHFGEERGFQGTALLRGWWEDYQDKFDPHPPEEIAAAAGASGDVIRG